MRKGARINLFDVIVYCVCMLGVAFVLSMLIFPSSAHAANTYYISEIEAWADPGYMGQYSSGAYSKVVVVNPSTGQSASEWVGQAVGTGVGALTASKFARFVGSAVPYLSGAAKLASYAGLALTAYQLWVVSGCPGAPTVCSPTPGAANQNPTATTGPAACIGGASKWMQTSDALRYGVGDVTQNGAENSNKGMGTSQADCEAAIGSCAGSSWGVTTNLDGTNGWSAPSGGETWESIDCASDTPDPKARTCYFCYNSGLPCGDVNTAITPCTNLATSHVLSNTELAAMLAQALAAGNKLALDYMQQATDAMNNANLQGALDLALATGSWSQFAQDLINALTAAQKAALDALLTNNSPSPTPTPSPGSPGQGGSSTLTDQSVTQDMETAIQYEPPGTPPPTGNVPSFSPAPAPDAESPPDKKSLVTVLQAFQSGLSQLPFVSFFQELAPSSADGSPVINLPMPDVMGGGDLPVDFSIYESQLDFIGDSLLAMVGIGWFLWFFRGRGNG